MFTTLYFLKCIQRSCELCCEYGLLCHGICYETQEYDKNPKEHLHKVVDERMRLRQKHRRHSKYLECVHNTLLS